VRDFSNHPHIPGSLRVTCPGREEDFQRLSRALDEALEEARPEEER
jgi:histidinol-phosphate/aromatic aminotransferase/cobyric acid decarboxylase-like protein